MNKKELVEEIVKDRKILLDFPPNTTPETLAGIAEMLGEQFDADVEITVFAFDHKYCQCEAAHQTDKKGNATP